MSLSNRCDQEISVVNTGNIRSKFVFASKTFVDGPWCRQ